MRILYLVYFNMEDTIFYGVKKKVEAQIECLNSMGHEADMAYCYNDKLVILSKNIKKVYNCKKGITNYRRGFFNLIRKNIKDFNYDTIYVRFPGSIDCYFYKTMKFLNANNIKCILEIPTYPIGGELKYALNNSIKQKKYFQFIKRCINCTLHFFFSRILHKTNIKIVTYMPNNKIWNIETICIDNGVDLNKINMVNKTLDVNKFNIVIAANMEIWHGIDRIILGLSEYIKNNPGNPRKVRLLIAGKGTVLEELKKIVIQKKIEKNVKFLGLLKEKELNNLYDQANIAVGSLALHRIGLKIGSTIKIKEYCAKGVPFILGYKEKKIDKSFKYALHVPADDSFINIEDLIEFFDKISSENYREKMNIFARENYDWKIQLKKVFF